MSSELIKVKITQQILETGFEKSKKDNKNFTPGYIVDGYDYSNYYVFEIVEDIEIPAEITFDNFDHVILINHTITNYGIIKGCNYWIVYNSKIANENTINICSDWVLINSEITNNIIQFNTSGFILINSIIKNGIIENNCNNWVIICSKIVDCTSTNNKYWLKLLDDEELMVVEKKEYEQLQNNFVNNSVGNVMSPIKQNTNEIINIISKDDDLKKLLLYTYLNDKDNGMLNEMFK